MGFMLYDGTTVQFEDRLLAHLQIIIVQKFTKKESFLLSWKDGPSFGDGRGSIWLSPNLPLYFKFLGSKSPEINREWLLALGKSADSTSGLIVVDEDGKLAMTGPASGQFPGTIR